MFSLCNLDVVRLFWWSSAILLLHDLNARSEKDAVETATVAAVERTMKKYADNLLRVLEGMSGRLAQLESNSSRMEHSVDKIKVDAADNFGATDGKLRSLENMIREVMLFFPSALCA